MTTITYSVPAVTCEHCTAAITGEVSQVTGVEDVHVDLEAKTVVVRGADLSDEAIRAAIDEAGFDVTS